MVCIFQVGKGEATRINMREKEIDRERKGPGGAERERMLKRKKKHNRKYTVSPGSLHGMRGKEKRANNNINTTTSNTLGIRKVSHRRPVDTCT